MNIWSVVPARKGSKGVFNKNNRPLGRATLIERAIETAMVFTDPKRIVLTTDYARTDMPSWVWPFYHSRPKHLCNDVAPMGAVLQDVASWLSVPDDDLVVLVQPTSLHENRAALIAEALVTKRLPCVSADRVPDKWHPYYCMDPDYPHAPPLVRQKLPLRYRPNGLFYILNGKMARAQSMWRMAPAFVETPGTLNIDTEDDWMEAERLYGRT